MRKSELTREKQRLLWEVFIIDNIEAKMKGKMVPIWEKYMLTVDEAVHILELVKRR